MHLGYAATGPGNQSDTRTISANLITPATTGRGLYVAMTRAREENTAYIVTPEPTLDAAKAVLEQVIDTDRTDTPAIVQRRELAAQLPAAVRVPEPCPRCTVPDWWHTLWNQTSAAFGLVRAELTDLTAKQEARRDKIAASRAEAEAASRALVPFERELNAADRQLTAAKKELADATANAAEHKVFGRRPAQERLATAVDAVETATVRHDAAVEARQPYRRAVYHTTRRFNETVETDRLQTAIEARHQLPERRQDLAARLHVLHNWRHWANGHDLPPTSPPGPSTPSKPSTTHTTPPSPTPSPHAPPNSSSTRSRTSPTATTTRRRSISASTSDLDQQPDEQSASAALGPTRADATESRPEPRSVGACRLSPAMSQMRDRGVH